METFLLPIRTQMERRQTRFDGDGQRRREQRDPLGIDDAGLPQVRDQAVQSAGWIGLPMQTEGSAKVIDDGVQGAVLMIGRTVPFNDRVVRPALFLSEGADDAHQTRFAEARIGDEENDVPHAFHRQIPALAEQTNFAVAAHERRQARGIGSLDTVADVAAAQCAIDRGRRSARPQPDFTCLITFEISVHEPMGGFGDHNSRRRQERLKSAHAAHDLADDGNGLARQIGDDSQARVHGQANRGTRLGQPAIVERQRSLNGRARCVLPRQRIPKASDERRTGPGQDQTVMAADDFLKNGPGEQELFVGILDILLAGLEFPGAVQQGELPPFRIRSGGFGSLQIDRGTGKVEVLLELKLGRSAQVFSKVGRRRVTVGWILGQGFQADALDFRGQFRPQLTRRLRCILANLPQYLLHVDAPERRAAAQHLVQCGAETVDIGAAIGPMGLAAHLFGRHEGRRADHHAALFVQVLLGQGNAKIDQHRPAFHQDDVPRLDVAMDDAPRMGMSEGIGDLSGNQDHLGPRRFLSMQPRRRKRRARQKFGNDEGVLVAHVDIVNRDDAGMSELGQAPGFFDEQLAALLSYLDVVGNLDRHGPIEPTIVPAIDRAEAALAETFREFVAIPKRCQQARADVGERINIDLGASVSRVRIGKMFNGIRK